MHDTSRYSDRAISATRRWLSRWVCAATGIEDTSARALAKQEAVLPHRLKLRVNALRDAVETGPDNTGTNAPDPAVDAGLLMVVAAAIRDHHEIRFHYRGDQRLLEPYRLVSWQRRWYLVARDASTDACPASDLTGCSYEPRGRSFTSVELPGGDSPAFVLRTTAFAGWHVHVRITVHAPAAEPTRSDQPHRRRRRSH